jgi:predicted membrane chloride channel (bestrophin family)
MDFEERKKNGLFLFAVCIALLNIERWETVIASGLITFFFMFSELINKFIDKKAGAKPNDTIPKG